MHLMLTKRVNGDCGSPVEQPAEVCGGLRSTSTRATSHLPLPTRASEATDQPFS